MRVNSPKQHSCTNISSRTGSSMRLRLMKGLLGIAFCKAMLTVVHGSPQAATTSATLPPRTNINPGLLYWQAFGAMPKLEEADRKRLDEFTDQLTSWSRSSSVSWAVKLPRDSDSLLKRYDRSLRLLHQARLSTTPCDWRCWSQTPGVCGS